MAAFGYSGRYGRKGFRGTRPYYRRFTRFSPYKKWSGGRWGHRGGSNRKTKSGSGKLLSRITALEKRQKDGETSKLELDLAVRLSTYWGGPLSSRKYFDLPITAIMREYMKWIKRTKLVVSGVSIEMQVENSHETELLLCGILRPLVMGVPPGQVVARHGGGNMFNFVGRGYEEKPILMGPEEDRVQAMVQGVFSKPAVDGSFFGAGMDNVKDWHVRQWQVKRGLEEQRTTRHRQLRLRFSESRSDKLGSSVKSESVRVYCAVDREVGTSVNEVDFVLFGGFRNPYSLPMTSGKEEGQLLGRSRESYSGPSLLGRRTVVTAGQGPLTMWIVTTNGSGTAIRTHSYILVAHAYVGHHKNDVVNLANPGGGTSPVKPEGSARFLGVWLDWKLNWKAHLVAVEKKLRTQSYALSRIVAKTWGMGLAEAREVYTKCIRSALAYGASSFHIPTDVGGEPVKKGITKALGKAQNKSLRIVAGAFKSTPIRNLETETWVPPLDLYLNKRLADFENRLQRPDLDDGQGGKKTAASVVLTACRKIQQRLSSRRGNRGRPRTLGPQGPTAVERAAGTVMRWTGRTVDTNRVVEEAWKARWLKERDGRAITRPADDFDLQQETLFRNETLRRHDGLSKAKSSLLIRIRTGAIGLRDFLFTRGVPEVLTPACECGEGRETAEHLVVWCLGSPLTRR
ncbi:hypothetical protein CHGG_03280 [Chaetomium globosum CBS 148.51]|uniref:Reverse transcriptase n=1 Tax=Chaetomium globosum (strain ATCC 6205 / CBS 148.51 / DSM 1962 / NBRC 6347 / NRRL 1970) TaxID=306901 RepID=Q2H924_CHAGB|nr:uncharacterized protein CHGG_03280 [Chaetomium globosum CBS 148.51]EAQ91345.1 hypothetical protein CHGG_03280 [Chaetomium globosum CBS 148.51]